MSHPHHAALAPLGWSPSRQAELDALGRPAAIPARIGRVDRGSSVAITAAGPVRAEAPGLVAGDWVALEDGRVAAVLARRTLLARRAAGRPDAEQAIAANIDVVAIVHGLDRPFRDRRLHRALVLAWDSGATPVVVLTKADLDPGAAARALDAEVAFGVDALPVSARTGAGLDALAARARPDRTLVLVGESGAGKSTLVNALLGHEALATRAVRGGDHKGRHTTTARHLVPLPGGGALVDTPGVRELGMWGSDDGVRAAFADIAALAEGVSLRRLPPRRRAGVRGGGRRRGRVARRGPARQPPRPGARDGRARPARGRARPAGVRAAGLAHGARGGPPQAGTLSR